MKLRIHGNSVRIRLKQSEMTRFDADGRVADRVELGLGAALEYVVETSNAIEALTLSFSGGTLRVTLPTRIARQWVETDEVGVEADIPTDSGHLRLLLEKDFKCLHRESSEDVSDYFPHPGA